MGIIARTPSFQPIFFPSSYVRLGDLRYGWTDHGGAGKCYAHLSLGPEGGRHIDWVNPPSDQENSPKKMKQGLPNRICKTWYRLAFGEHRGSLCSIQQALREVETRLDTFGIPGSKLTRLYDAEASLGLPDQVKLNNLFRFLEVPLRLYTLYPVQAPRAC
jgi:hypothetical protein